MRMSCSPWLLVKGTRSSHRKARMDQSNPFNRSNGLATELRLLVSQFGLDVVTAYMGHVQDNAEEAVRRVIARLRDGECAYELDNGAVINVAVRVDQDEI